MNSIQTATGPLQPSEIMFYRNIKKTAIVLVILARLGRPTGPTEIARILDITRETAQAHLESLDTTGLITRSGIRDGWKLTDDGRQLVLQLNAASMLEETHMHAFGTQPHELTLHTQAAGATTPALGPLLTVLDVSENPTFEPGQAAQNERMSEKPTLNVGNSDIQTLKKIEEEISKNLIIDSSSTLLRETNVGKSDIAISVATLLEHSELLFAPNSVLTIGLALEKIDADLALGWLAQAWSESSRLNNPAGLVYARLKAADCPKPKPKYYYEPLKYLPREYLVQVGLAEPETYRCDDCKLDFGTDYEAWLEHHEEIDAPRLAEQGRIERQQMLDEMQARKKAEYDQLEAERAARKLAELDAKVKSQGCYFKYPTEAISALAWLFEKEPEKQTKARELFGRALDFEVVDSYTYNACCRSADLAQALREGWQDEAERAEQHYPGLRMVFRHGMQKLDPETNQVKTIWLEE
jgi:DNA-binding MarR family transcriptional regulator